MMTTTEPTATDTTSVMLITIPVDPQTADRITITFTITALSYDVEIDGPARLTHEQAQRIRLTAHLCLDPYIWQRVQRWLDTRDSD